MILAATLANTMCDKKLKCGCLDKALELMISIQPSWGSSCANCPQCRHCCLTGLRTQTSHPGLRILLGTSEMQYGLWRV